MKAPTRAGSTRNRNADFDRLRSRLAEAEHALSAIRSGDVDAIVVDGPNGRMVYSLQGPDQPYRVLVERMSEGAATADANGTILFCNARLACRTPR